MSIRSVTSDIFILIKVLVRLVLFYSCSPSEFNDPMRLELETTSNQTINSPSDFPSCVKDTGKFLR